LWGIITVAESRSLIMTVKNVNCALNYKSNEKPAFYLVIREARRRAALTPSRYAHSLTEYKTQMMNRLGQLPD